MGYDKYGNYTPEMINGIEVDEFQYNDLMSQANSLGQNFGGNTFSGGNNFAPSTTASGAGGAMDWLNQNQKGLGTAMQGIGLASNLYSTYFGQGKKAFDKNMELLNQQIASNKELADRRTRLNDAWAKYGNGLAASTVK